MGFAFLGLVFAIVAVVLGAVLAILHKLEPRDPQPPANVVALPRRRRHLRSAA